MENYYSEEKVKMIRKCLVNSPNYFCEKTEIHLITDVIKFKIRNPQNIIFIDEFFLCDFYCNEIWIVKLIKNLEYDPVKKKRINVRAIKKVVDCQNKQGLCIFPRFNGYWKIPNI